MSPMNESHVWLIYIWITWTFPNVLSLTSRVSINSRPDGRGQQMSRVELGTTLPPEHTSDSSIQNICEDTELAELNVSSLPEAQLRHHRVLLWVSHGSGSAVIAGLCGKIRISEDSVVDIQGWIFWDAELWEKQQKGWMFFKTIPASPLFPCWSSLLASASAGPHTSWRQSQLTT